MLLPERIKYRHQHCPKTTGRSRGGSSVTFGEYGLQATATSWVTSRQIGSAHIAMTRYMKHGGKVWIKIFPYTSYTKKPLEVCMGAGKGTVEGRIIVVRPDYISLEIAGVSEGAAREALRLTNHKLPAKTKLVKREELGGEASKS